MTNQTSVNTEIKSAFKDIYSNFAAKTEELFEMYKNRIPGLETKVRDPSFEFSTDESKIEYLGGFPSFYQIEGVQFLLDQKRILISDEMGVGKTAQAIAGKVALENKLGEKVKTLIVCPNEKVKKMWSQRLKEYIIEERYESMNVEQVDDYKKAEVSSADVVVIDYHALSFSKEGENNFNRKELKKKLVEAGFNYVVLDEVHNVKNHTSANRFGHIHDIVSKSEYLCLLSGTPIPNNIDDTYALISLLNPERTDEKGNLVGYKDASAVKAAHTRTPSVVGAILRASRLERKLEDILDMPKKREETINIESLSPAQQEIYDSIYEDDSLLGLQKVQKLQQALLNPSIIDSSHSNISSAKFEKLDEIIREKINRGEKVVVYSPHFKEGVTKYLEERYKDYGVLRMDGDNNYEHHSHLKKFKQDDKAKIMVMTRVGAEGIPLTAANNLVFLEEPYSPGEKKQVTGRVWRPGQKKEVNVLTLNVKGTIDEGIKDFLEKKRTAIEYVEKGVPLTDEQKVLLNGENSAALANWLLQIDKNYLYTPMQVTCKLMNNLRERPEEMVVKRLSGKMGEQLADSLAKGWDNSFLENSAEIYSSIFNAIEEREGKLEKIIDIASGFGALSHKLKRRGIYNLDADKHHFVSPYASEENINLVGSMTKLPLENNSFDFALCSMGLHVLPNNSEEPARAKAVLEANRILKEGGYYVMTLSAPMVPEDDTFLQEGMQNLGFEIVPELTGFVKSKDKKINTHAYVLTARKYFEMDSNENISILNKNFELNSSLVARKKGHSQRRKGLATEFEFVKSGEDLQIALQKFISSK